MRVVTRFAPSPTGFLHIGSARTALFNWLFTRHHQGLFRLRIEDTDRQRSTQEAIDAICRDLRWLELFWDDAIVYQSSRQERHQQVAYRLLERNRAYRCYATPQELEQMRLEQKQAGLPLRYDGRWRDRPPLTSDQPFVIRLKTPQSGQTCLEDQIQGSISVDNSTLDDLVLLRADQSPTYMLAVVVDDHDMGITNVIRGHDHLTNTFRQLQIYHALEWSLPRFAHIPMIHGADGAKLSKRHGALGIDVYRDQGYLPEAIRNYLTRLGWSHGNLEIFTTEEAVPLFSLEKVGRSPARFDLSRLQSLNAHYIRHSSALLPSLSLAIETKLQRALLNDEKNLLQAALPSHRSRAKTLTELAEGMLFYLRPPTVEPPAPEILDRLRQTLNAVHPWQAQTLEDRVREQAQRLDLKMIDLAQPLRLILTGSTASPPIFTVAELLGERETLRRIRSLIPPR